MTTPTATDTALAAERADWSTQVNNQTARAEAAEQSAAALRAQLDQPRPLPPLDVRPIPADFPASDIAGAWVPGGFTGRGREQTLMLMPDHSSTRADDIAAIVKPSTNRFALLRMGGTSGTPVDGATAEGFTLLGPDLGHTFNGLFVGPGRNAIVRDVRVRGILGRDGGPPQETGSVIAWKQTGLELGDVILDGRNLAGQAIASSLLMLTACDDTTITDLDAGWAAHGFGAALFQCGSAQFTGAAFHDCFVNVNIEQANPNSEYTFDRCTFGPVAHPSKHHLQVSTRQGGRAKVTIIDPVGDGKIIVRLRGQGVGGNGMRDTDVRVVVAGQDVTSSRLQITR